jgi:hypothetical protein
VHLVEGSDAGRGEAVVVQDRRGLAIGEADQQDVDGLGDHLGVDSSV